MQYIYIYIYLRLKTTYLYTKTRNHNFQKLITKLRKLCIKHNYNITTRPARALTVDNDL